LKNAGEISERLRSLYGEDPAEACGVLHAAAVWRSPEGVLRVIRIGPGCPASETDEFVLRSARMRSQALVTTGRILRAEPDVTHIEQDTALLAWRRDQVGRSEPPRSVVLTSGRHLDLHHPLLKTGHRPMIVSDEGAAESLRLAARKAGLAVEVVGRPRPSIRDTLSLLEGQGCQTILVEAGPTTATPLYDEPVRVDELLLSVHDAETLDDVWTGPQFVGLRQLEAIFERRSVPASRRELGGQWTFHRLTRNVGKPRPGAANPKE